MAEITALCWDMGGVMLTLGWDQNVYSRRNRREAARVISKGESRYNVTRRFFR